MNLKDIDFSDLRDIRTKRVPVSTDRALIVSEHDDKPYSIPFSNVVVTSVNRYLGQKGTLSTISPEVRQITGDLKRNQHQQRKLNDHIDNLGGNLSDLYDNLETLNDNLGDLSQYQGTLSAYINNLNSNLSTLQKNIGDLSQYQGTLVSELNGLDTGLSTLETNIGDLSGYQGTLVQELSGLNSELDDKLDDTPGVITEAYIGDNEIGVGKLKVNNIFGNSAVLDKITAQQGFYNNLASSNLWANTATFTNAFIDNIVGNSAFFDKLTTGTTLTDKLTAKTAFVNTLAGKQAFFDSVTSNDLWADKIIGIDAFFTNLTTEQAFVNKIVTSELWANTGTFNDAFVSNITGNQAFFDQIVTSDLWSDSATFNQAFIDVLTSDQFFTSDLIANKASINDLLAVNATLTESLTVGQTGNVTIGPNPTISFPTAQNTHSYTQQDFFINGSYQGNKWYSSSGGFTAQTNGLVEFKLTLTGEVQTQGQAFSVTLQYGIYNLTTNEEESIEDYTLDGNTFVGGLGSSTFSKTINTKTQVNSGDSYQLFARAIPNSDNIKTLQATPSRAEFEPKTFIGDTGMYIAYTDDEVRLIGLGGGSGGGGSVNTITSWDNITGKPTFNISNWNAAYSRNTNGYAVTNTTGTWFEATVGDDSESYIFRGQDSGGNNIGSIVTRGLDGAGAGYLDLNGAWRLNDDIIWTQGNLSNVSQLSNDAGYYKSGDTATFGETTFNGIVHIPMTSQQVRFSADGSGRDWAYWYNELTETTIRWKSNLEANNDLSFTSLGAYDFVLDSEVKVLGSLKADQLYGDTFTFDMNVGSSSYPRRITGNTPVGGLATFELQTYNNLLGRLSTRILMRGGGGGGVEFYNIDENLSGQFTNSGEFQTLKGFQAGSFTVEADAFPHFDVAGYNIVVDSDTNARTVFQFKQNGSTVNRLTLLDDGSVSITDKFQADSIYTDKLVAELFKKDETRVMNSKFLFSDGSLTTSAYENGSLEIKVKQPSFQSGDWVEVSWETTNGFVNQIVHIDGTVTGGYSFGTDYVGSLTPWPENATVARIAGAGNRGNYMYINADGDPYLGIYNNVTAYSNSPFNDNQSNLTTLLGDLSPAGLPGRGIAANSQGDNVFYINANSAKIGGANFNKKGMWSANNAGIDTGGFKDTGLYINFEQELISMGDLFWFDSRTGNESRFGGAYFDNETIWSTGSSSSSDRVDAQWALDDNGYRMRADTGNINRFRWINGPIDQGSNNSNLIFDIYGYRDVNPVPDVNKGIIRVQADSGVPSELYLTAGTIKHQGNTQFNDEATFNYQANFDNIAWFHDEIRLNNKDTGSSGNVITLPSNTNRQIDVSGYNQVFLNPQGGGAGLYSMVTTGTEYILSQLVLIKNISDDYEIYIRDAYSGSTGNIYTPNHDNAFTISPRGMVWAVYDQDGDEWQLTQDTGA